MDSGEKNGRAIHVCFNSPLGYGLYRPESGHAFGGAEVQFYLLSQEISKDPLFQVSVLTTVDDAPGTDRIGGLALIKRKGQGRPSSQPSLASMNFINLLKGYVSAFKDMYVQFREIGADVYFHAGAGVEVGAYAIICRLLNRKFVFVVASPHDICAPYGQVKGWLKWLYPLGVSWSDSVVCRSLEQQQWLKDRYGRDGTLIRTGHPIPIQSQTERTTLLWVGRAHPVKQPEMFIDLAKRLPRCPCTMVLMTSPESKEMHEDIRRRAASTPNLRIQENVHWVDVEQFFQEAKILVNTSTDEGFPNTFVQAAFQGIPILSWAVDPDRILATYGIGVCANQSFGQLLSQAQRYMESETLCKETGQRAVHYAHKFHDLDMTSGCYKELVYSHVRPSSES